MWLWENIKLYVWLALFLYWTALVQRGTGKRTRVPSRKRPGITQWLQQFWFWSLEMPAIPVSLIKNTFIYGKHENIHQQFLEYALIQSGGGEPITPWYPCPQLKLQNQEEGPAVVLTPWVLAVGHQYVYILIIPNFTHIYSIATARIGSWGLNHQFLNPIPRGLVVVIQAVLSDVQHTDRECTANSYVGF